jgi:hypothetical protein
VGEQRKCACRFGSLGPASFKFCQRCGKRHDGGDGQAGVRHAKWVSKALRSTAALRKRLRRQSECSPSILRRVVKKESPRG